MAAYARCVHREIKENLATTSVVRAECALRRQWWADILEGAAAAGEVVPGANILLRYCGLKFIFARSAIEYSPVAEVNGAPENRSIRPGPQAMIPSAISAQVIWIGQPSGTVSSTIPVMNNNPSAACGTSQTCHETCHVWTWPGKHHSNSMWRRLPCPHRSRATGRTRRWELALGRNAA